MCFEAVEIKDIDAFKERVVGKRQLKRKETEEYFDLVCGTNPSFGPDSK